MNVRFSRELNTFFSIIFIGIFLLTTGICINCYTHTQHTNTTKYATNTGVGCNIMQMERKGCATLLNCEDGNTYLCVNNVKMYVDKP